MKKTCGIELKGNEARIVVLEGSQDNYEIITTAPNKIKITDPNNQEEIKGFFNETTSFFNSFEIGSAAIKERATKGKFAGGSVSFKMEALIQNTDTNITLIHSRTLKSKLKGIELDFSSVNKYQEEALKLAWVLLS